MDIFLGITSYLSEELVAFVILPFKRALDDLDVALKKDLHDFTLNNTTRYFKILNVPSGLLQKDKTEWKEDESYKKSKAIVGSLRVINDVVELGVDLME
ncbi:hypothetical protein AVEN_35573-1 [Araneus ventricosus]|uniref:Uncharacterized protein n=1 Tax=Araneus ventricosus TaxID=182803 RepID=A0A4Y2CJ59_ARAVE|nr:hypothetical protein AVEN_35573-1 [Araneus ventricosus]